MRAIAVRLFESARRLQQVEKAFRVSVTNLVGCDVSDWTLDDLMRWTDGALAALAAERERKTREERKRNGEAERR